MSIPPEISQAVQQAVQFEQQGNFEKAKSTYFQALNQFQDHDHIFYRLALLYTNEKKLNQALRFASWAVEKKPDTDLYYSLLFHIQFMAGMLNEALNSVETAIKLQPTGNYLNNRAAILTKMNRFKDAFDSLVQAIKLDSDNPGPHFDRLKDLAMIIFHTAVMGFPPDKLADAHRLIKNSIIIYQFLAENGDDSYSAIGHYHVGQLLRYFGDIESALKCFENASLKAPHWEAPKFQHDTICRQKNTPNKIKGSGGLQMLTVHTGVGHAASTWLQGYFFPNLAGLNHMGATVFDMINVEDVIENHLEFPVPGSTVYRTLSENNFNQRQAEDTLRQLMSNQRSNLISSESLSSQKNINLVIKRLTHLKNALNIEIKILLIIRRQADAVRANYSHKIKFGVPEYNRPLCELIDWDGNWQTKPGIPVPDHDYLEKYENYCSAFGAEHILLIPYESVFSKDLMSLKKICHFTGAAVDEEQLRRMLARPPLNSTGPEVMEKINQMNPDKDQLLEKIREQFIDSNRQLDQLLGLGLKELNYY